MSAALANQSRGSQRCAGSSATATRLLRTRSQYASFDGAPAKRQARPERTICGFMALDGLCWRQTGEINGHLADGRVIPGERRLDRHVEMILDVGAKADGADRIEPVIGKRLVQANLLDRTCHVFGDTGADEFANCGDRHGDAPRSEEHTSELQSHSDLVCRLL